MDSFSSFIRFRLDQLSGFVAVSIGVFFLLTCMYSAHFMKGRRRLWLYYLYLILTALSAAAAVLADNLILLLTFWGFLGLTLYLLINFGENAAFAAKKTLIIVGGSDALMLLGIALIFCFSGTLQMSAIKLPLDRWPLVLAYLCVAIGCFAKAGIMPFHSWIPDCAEKAPIPVTAYLPASLDKLLGIYLLSRVSLGLFVMNKAMNALLMFAGASTIIAAVMMALTQHNIKRLLGYHAVSQVGYMVLGIGTGNPVGIAGGIFHMLNHAVYKSCLFFTAGNVEYRTNKTELDELGGLAKPMPFTYISCLIASLSICGIPPLNGFTSKWLIYQGLVLDISGSGSIWHSGFAVFCLVAAMFGSALTLASFMKLLHGVFMGERLNAAESKAVKEAPFSMWLPCVLLAFVCVLFGVWAFVLPLKYLIFPAVSLYQQMDASLLMGSWSPTAATALIIAGLLFGLLFFRLGKKIFFMRQDNTFVGGEQESREENMVTGTEFYNTIKDMAPFSKVYRRAERGEFDIYQQGKKVFALSSILQRLHNGVLSTYLVWMLLGMLGVSLFFIK
ncbi:MAG TPA: complex I subunit 5 family protein [Candidatus Margulisiibacteriota bacterium]|nr:complex I subunit 5 family protein [Candidatus Margulisiibacteriota bacterium]